MLPFRLGFPAMAGLGDVLEDLRTGALRNPGLELA